MRMAILASIIIGVLFLTGCVTTVTSDAPTYEFNQLEQYRLDKDDSLAIVGILSDRYSVMYTDILTDRFKSGGFSPVELQDIQTAFPSYPTNIFSGIYSDSTLPSEELGRLQLIAQKLAVEYVIAVGFRETTSTTTTTNIGTGAVSKEETEIFVTSAYLYRSSDSMILGHTYLVDSISNFTSLLTDWDAIYEQYDEFYHEQTDLIFTKILESSM